MRVLRMIVDVALMAWEDWRLRRIPCRCGHGRIDHDTTAVDERCVRCKCGDFRRMDLGWGRP